MPKEAHAADGMWGVVRTRSSGVVLAPLGRAQTPAMHQQKKTCLQLPYNALLHLTKPVRHNKAL